MLCVCTIPVFSPTDNQWMVTSVMNETDMSDEVGYTKRVLDCLSVFRRECQMMEREVPKGPMTGGGGEGQVQLLVEQQLKRNDEEVRGHYTCMSVSQYSTIEL